VRGVWGVLNRRACGPQNRLVWVFLHSEGEGEADEGHETRVNVSESDHCNVTEWTPPGR
jgi:hypothetical protein